MPSVAQTDAAAPPPRACATTSRTAGPGVRQRMLSVTTNRAHTSRLTSVISADRVVDRDQLGAVGEGALDLHLVDHLGNAFHHFITAEDRQARLHQLGDGAPVADALEDVGRVAGEARGELEVLKPGTAPAPHLLRREKENRFHLPG